MTKVLVLMFSLLVLQLEANTSRITLVSEPYPPQFSYDLPEYGWLHHLVAHTFNSMKIKTDLDLVNWKRAMHLTNTRPNYVLLGAFYNEERAAKFNYSTPIGISEIGYFKLTTRQLTLSNNLASLEGLIVSKSRDHIISDEFDLNSNLVKFETADLVESLNLLMAKRVDVVIGSKDTGLYLLQNDFRLKRHPKLSLVEYVEPAYISKDLHLAISKNFGQGVELMNGFDQAYKTLVASEQLNAILKQHNFDNSQIEAFRNFVLNKTSPTRP